MTKAPANKTNKASGSSLAYDWAKMFTDLREKRQDHVFMPAA
jgi:hypothetical protein